MADSGGNADVRFDVTESDGALAASGSLSKLALRRLSDRDVKVILAKHLGWLSHRDGTSLPEHDKYLEHIEPTYPDWSTEARNNPERADLSFVDFGNANLSGANLDGANLCSARLVDVDLRGQDPSLALPDEASPLTIANIVRGIEVSAASERAGVGAGSWGGAADITDEFRDGAWLRANLSRADLRHADLSGVDGTAITFSGAHLELAILSGATLSDADLRGASLSGATMDATAFARADLTNADLSHVHAHHASFDGTVLTNAKLAYADLTNSAYAPASESPHPHVAGVEGILSLEVPRGEELGLVQLRKLFVDAALRDLEREATCVIERTRTSEKFEAFKTSRRRKSTERVPKSAGGGWLSDRFAVFEGVFRKVAFDWTCAYGLHPSRALMLIVAIWLCLTPVYLVSMARGAVLSSHVGIYEVFPGGRIDDTTSVPTIADRSRVARIAPDGAGLWSALRWAAYFSLLSATNIGFQQFTPGDWIRRLQPHDFTLQAEGWARVVSGAQALLSLYLLAIWALTYFGRPFK